MLECTKTRIYKLMSHRNPDICMRDYNGACSSCGCKWDEVLIGIYEWIHRLLEKKKDERRKTV